MRSGFDEVVAAYGDLERAVLEKPKGSPRMRPPTVQGHPLDGKCPGLGYRDYAFVARGSSSRSVEESSKNDFMGFVDDWFQIRFALKFPSVISKVEKELSIRLSIRRQGPGCIVKFQKSSPAIEFDPEDENSLVRAAGLFYDALIEWIRRPLLHPDDDLNRRIGFHEG